MGKGRVKNKPTTSDEAAVEILRLNLREVPTPDGWPTTLSICSQRWAVRYVEKSDEFNGLCLPNKTLLILAVDQSQENMRLALTHELLHALMFVSQVEVKHKTHERVVTALAPVLLDALRANARWW